MSTNETGHTRHFLRAPASLLLCAVLLTSFGLRLAGAIWPWRQLDPDAETYLYIAAGLLRGSYSSIREPLFPVAVAVFFALFGVGSFTLRLTTVFFGTVWTLVLYKVTRSLFNQSTALMASACLATAPYVVWNATRGLREELFGCLLLVFLYFGVFSGRFSRRRWLLTGLMAGLLFMTKMEGAVAVFAVFAYLLWQDRGKVKAFLKYAVPLFGVFLCSYFAYEMILGLGGGALSYHLYGTPTQKGWLTALLEHSTPIEFASLIYFGTNSMVRYLGWVLLFCSPLLVLGLYWLIRERRALSLLFVSLIFYIFWAPLIGIPADKRLLIPYLSLPIMIAYFAADRICRNLSSQNPSYRLLWSAFLAVNFVVGAYLYLSIFVRFPL